MCKSDLQDGTLVPCFQQPYEWWLDLVAIFRKREYQPAGQYVLDEMLREIRHQLAQSQQLRPEQAAESRLMIEIKVMRSWSCVIALCASPRHG